MQQVSIYYLKFCVRLIEVVTHKKLTAGKKIKNFFLSNPFYI